MFSNETDGTTVRISAKHGGQRIEARGNSFADIAGDGGWSGDLFETGATSSVAFNVGGTAEAPTISGITVNAAADIEATVGDVSVESYDHHGKSGVVAKVSIEFSSFGQERTMTIKAQAGTGRDGEPYASLKVSLGRVKGRQIIENAVGEHQWSGTTCTEEAATIDYTVDASGVARFFANAQSRYWTNPSPRSARP